MNNYEILTIKVICFAEEDIVRTSNVDDDKDNFVDLGGFSKNNFSE